MASNIEFCEIPFSKLNSDLRLDAEYFSSDYMNKERVLLSIAHKSLEEISVFISDGIHTSIDYDSSSSINLISATSPKKNFFNLSRGAKISAVFHAANSRTSLKVGDVIVSTVGTIGNVAVVDESVLPANCDRHVGIIRLKSGYQPEFVSSFLLGKYGRYQTERETTGNVQPNLFIYKLKELIIPDFSVEFQLKVKALVDEAREKLAESRSLMIDCNKKMLDLIGYQLTDVPNDSITIKSLSSSFGASGRLDAEYYLEKYNYYQALIENYGNGFSTISSYFDLVKTNCARDSEFYDYVEIGDVDVDLGVAYSNSISTDLLPDNAKIMTEAGELVISTVRPNRGAVAILDKDNLLVSGAFCVLKEKGIYNCQTLQVLLRTPLYKDWLLKFNTGTSYPVIKNEDILSLPVPLFETHFMNYFAECVNKAKQKIIEANRLNELAIRCIEVAVEEGEEKALLSVG